MDRGNILGYRQEIPTEDLLGDKETIMKHAPGYNLLLIKGQPFNYCVGVFEYFETPDKPQPTSRFAGFYYTSMNNDIYVHCTRRTTFMEEQQANTIARAMNLISREQGLPLSFKAFKCEDLPKTGNGVWFDYEDVTEDYREMMDKYVWCK